MGQRKAPEDKTYKQWKDNGTQKGVASNSG